MRPFNRASRYKAVLSVGFHLSLPSSGHCGTIVEETDGPERWLLYLYPPFLIWGMFMKGLARYKAMIGVGLVAGIAATASLTPVFANSGASSADVVAEWSNEVWRSAMQGDSGGALALLERIPDAAGSSNEVVSLQRSVAQYQANVMERASSRLDRLSELDEELAEHIANDEVLEGLRAANELYQLSFDKEATLADPRVSGLVREAEQKAHDFEDGGKWLDAHAHYNLLHLLFYDQMTYKDDLTRVLQRLQMLGMYLPENLHDLRSAQRVAMDEDPLPPFNDTGETWEDKFEEINFDMVLRAISYADQAQVDDVGLAPMLAGGYRSVRNMVTMPDLCEAFPTLGDRARIRPFLQYVDERLTYIERNADALQFSDLYSSLKSLEDANERTIDISYKALLHEFGNGAMGELDDFTGVVWPYDVERFTRTTSGEFKGVGIQITLDEAMQLKVVTPLQGTPASRAGIRPGDLIREIDGESTLGVSLTQAVDQITGDPGTRVTLGIERVGVEDIFPVELTRAVIPIHSIKGWQRSGQSETDWEWFVDPEMKIGYVRLSQFTRHTSDDLRKALSEMRREGLRGLVLDLRWNPGGLLDEAVDIVSYFVDSRQVVVTQRDAQGKVRDEQKTRRAPIRVGEDVPVVVLVNGGSASASEIVAGCLQDYEKALIIGERSFGKGSVQNVFPLADDNARFKLTTQYYYLPSGRLIHRRDGSETWGIEPDVKVEPLPTEISDALALRQDADVVEFDEQGHVVPRDGEEVPDPTRLLTEGLDPQLETAVLLVKSQLVSRSAVN